MNAAATTRNGISAAIALAVACCFLGFLTSAAIADGVDPDRLIAVQFKGGTTASERIATRKSVDATYAHSLAAPGLQQVAIPKGDSATAAAIALRADPNVELAAADGHFTADDDLVAYWNDPFFDQQWSIRNFGQVFLTEITPGGPIEYSGTPGADINAANAWPNALPIGDPGGDPIGVIDTGIAAGHEDLADSLLINSEERDGTEGVDDDSNGLVDDVNGWNFYDDNDDLRDFYGHGTHVASIASATTDNAKGISGVSAWSNVLPLKAADDTGLFSWAAIRQSVTYGLARGVRVFNGSFGGPEMDQAFDAIIAANPDALFIFSAGNGGSDKIGDDHDDSGGLKHRYPCDVGHDNVVCVAATDWNDQLTSFSDYGVDSVDIASPGARIYAAKPCQNISSEAECPTDEPEEARVGYAGGPGAYQLLSGTSMSTPMVAGAASLLWGSYPSLHSSQIKNAIVNSGQPLSELTTKVAYGSRLDLAAALTAASEFETVEEDWPVPPPQPPAPDEGDQDGGTGGTIGTVPPPALPAPIPAQPTTPAPKPLRYRVYRPRVARIGRSKRIKLKLRCSARCSAMVTVRPEVSKLKQFRRRVGRRGPGTRAIKVRIPTRRLRALRALVREGVRPRVYFSVVVKDAKGAEGMPVVFSIRLKR